VDRAVTGPLGFRSVIPVSIDTVRRALEARSPARLSRPLPHRSSVAIVLRPVEAGLEALFIQRAERVDDPWSGQVAFPGGRAEPGESSVGTAIRETAEEVGLDLSTAADLLGGLDEIQAVGRRLALELSIQPWVFALHGPIGPLRCSDEVASAHWLRLSELFDPARQRPFLYEHEGATIRLPSVHAGALVIWGLTYRMLQSLAEVVDGGAAGAP